MPVRNREVDEPKERIKRRTKQRQKVAHGGNHFRENEPNDPYQRHHDDPHAPSNDGVGMRVPTLPHDAEVHELRTDIGINNANDERWDNDKRERCLLVHYRAQAPKRRRRGILSEISEADRRGDNEQERRHTAEHGQRFGEILRPFHLRDERREQNLRDPEERDVQHGVHGCDKGGAGGWEGVGMHGPGCGVFAIVAVQRRVFDAGEDEEEQDGEAHAGGAEHGHEGDVVEGAGQRHYDAHDCDDDGEDDGAEGVVGEGVDYFCAGEHVEADEHDVVEQQHDGGEFVGDFGLAEGVVAEVADVFDLRVLHDEFVHGQRCDVEEHAGNDHGDYARYPAEDAEV